MEKLELRVVHSSLTVNDNDLIVEGLVNRTESWSFTLGMRKKFREKISKGAFDKAIQSSQRIDFLAEHDTSKLLSTTENNSLELWEDEEGLKMRAKICPTSYGKDMYELMSHNIVNHMSFGFRALSDRWKKLSDGTFERIVDALELIEVSVVRNPAYPQSAIAARGIELVEDVDIPEDILEERSQEEMENEQIKEVRDLITNLIDKVDKLEKALETIPDKENQNTDVDTDLEKNKTESQDEIDVEADTKVDAEPEDKSELSTKEVEEENVEENQEVDESKDEGRSFDLSAYRDRIRERR